MQREGELATDAPAMYPIVPRLRAHPLHIGVKGRRRLAQPFARDALHLPVVLLADKRPRARRHRQRHLLPDQLPREVGGHLIHTHVRILRLW